MVLHALAMTTILLNPDPAVETDEQNQDRCRAEARALHETGSSRTSAYLACRDAYERKEREAVAAAYNRRQAEVAAQAAAERAAAERADEVRAEAARQREAEYQAERARQAAEVAAWEAEEARAAAELEKKCGRDYMRVEVGMAWRRVEKCAGPFSAIGQASRNGVVVTVYSAAGGTVYVRAGKIVAWTRAPE